LLVLVTPSFFRVVTDKVLAHRGYTFCLEDRDSDQAKHQSVPSRLSPTEFEGLGQYMDEPGRIYTGNPGRAKKVTNPLLRIASQAMNDMQRIGAQFGLTPNGRLRLSGIKPPPVPSKFDGLLGTGEPGDAVAGRP
jgi:hypothetical protein